MDRVQQALKGLMGPAKVSGGRSGKGWAGRELIPDAPEPTAFLLDVDECATGGRCQHGECANTHGGYTCVCPDGFLHDSSRSSCICEPREWVEAGMPACKPGPQTPYQSTPGSLIPLDSHDPPRLPGPPSHSY